MSNLLQHSIDALSVGALYALYALGVALIFGVMRLINFAYGELIMITGYALVVFAGLPVPVLVLVGIGGAVALALLMERIAFRPVRGADTTTLLVTSFAVSYLLQSAASLIFSSTPKSTTLLPQLSGALSLGSISVPKLSLTILVVTAALLSGVLWLLRKTMLGVQMRAAAEDFGMTRLLGVRANTVIGAAFAVSGLIAGVAGVLYIAQTGTVTPTLGVTPVLYAFIGTIVGGLGSLLGAVIGGMSLGVAQVALQVSLPTSLQSYRDAFVFLFVLAVLVLRPGGLIVPSSQLKRV